jgi:deferrochelatase/peroxidase EfeB
MQGGSYLVVRKIRIVLEHWDRTPVDFQEQTIGRQRYSGAPLGGKSVFDPLDLAALAATDKPAIPQNAHVRMAAAAPQIPSAPLWPIGRTMHQDEIIIRIIRA